MEPHSHVSFIHILWQGSVSCVFQTCSQPPAPLAFKRSKCLAFLFSFSSPEGFVCVCVCVCCVFATYSHTPAPLYFKRSQCLALLFSLSPPEGFVCVCVCVCVCVYV